MKIRLVSGLLFVACGPTVRPSAGEPSSTGETQSNDGAPTMTATSTAATGAPPSATTTTSTTAVAPDSSDEGVNFVLPTDGGPCRAGCCQMFAHNFCAAGEKCMPWA
ncbi:MAG: hypothetical protein K0V04_09635, partial [Deltaproteobacteria bacterium]|nr:hypothetical protein [Deltaproteobacteria bacterium]